MAKAKGSNLRPYAFIGSQYFQNLSKAIDREKYKKAVN